MLSVVVPTMWKYFPFVSFINNLCKLEVVDDIILINNNRNETPHDNLRLTDKVRIVDTGDNLFVNPSWNLGVQMAKNDNVCIINDDVMVDFKLFILMDEFMTHNKESFGLAGIHPGDHNFGQIPFTDGSIDIIAWQEDMTSSSAGMRFGLGTLFFVSKDKWVPIPDGLNFYYGDDWVFETSLLNGFHNYLITNCLYHSPNAQTCTFMMQQLSMDDILSREGSLYIKELAAYKPV